MLPPPAPKFLFCNSEDKICFLGKVFYRLHNPPSEKFPGKAGLQKKEKKKEEKPGLIGGELGLSKRFKLEIRGCSCSAMREEFHARINPGKRENR